MESLDHPSREHSWEKGPHWKTSENQDGMVKSSYLSANIWDIFFETIAIYAGILSHVDSWLKANKYSRSFAFL